MSTKVLIADKQGTPKEWVSHRDAANYYSNDKVLWEIGSPIKVFYGGFNKFGEQSSLTISSIVGVSGPILGTKFYDKETVYAERMVMYARDRHLCGYCGDQFEPGELTIDHVNQNLVVAKTLGSIASLHANLVICVKATKLQKKQECIFCMFHMLSICSSA